MEKDPKKSLILDESTFITVDIKGKKYALKLFDLQEVTLLPKITFLPNKDFISGIFHLRGRLVFIADVGKVLDASSSVKNESRYVVICNVKDQLIGIVVSAVSEVFIGNQDSESDSLGAQGNIKANGEIIPTLQLNKILEQYVSFIPKPAI